MADVLGMLGLDDGVLYEAIGAAGAGFLINAAQKQIVDKVSFFNQFGKFKSFVAPALIAAGAGFSRGDSGLREIRNNDMLNNVARGVSVGAAANIGASLFSTVTGQAMFAPIMGNVVAPPVMRPQAPYSIRMLEI